MTRLTPDDVADRASYSVFQRAAKAAKMSVSRWMRDNGIVGSGLASQIERNEVPMSVLPERVQEALHERHDWNNEFPGGMQVASIIGNGKVRQGDMPKRRRGRPRKHFVRVGEEE